MCGCDRTRGYICGHHQREEKAMRSVREFRFLCDVPEPPKPADYIARIRAGQD